MLIRKRTPCGLKQLIAPRTQSFLIRRLTRMTLSITSAKRMERVWEFCGLCKVFFTFLNLCYTSKTLSNWDLERLEDDSFVDPFPQTIPPQSPLKSSSSCSFFLFCPVNKLQRIRVDEHRFISRKQICLRISLVKKASRKEIKQCFKSQPEKW